MDVRQSVLSAIGNTPIVRLNKIGLEVDADILVKLEFYNPTGSYKDRMALAMVEEAEKEGLLKPGDTVIEYTGGSTGSSLALICAVKGYPMKIVSSDAFSEEKLRTMRAFGAELVIVPSRNRKITPDLVPMMIEKARELARQSNTYWTNQFYNKHQLKGHNRLGEEILTQLDGKLDAFVAGVGTAGCAMGVSQVLKSKDKRIKVYLVEPEESPVISKGTRGTHHVEGIGSGLVPPLLQEGLYDGVITVHEDEAKEMARRLTKIEGVFAGTSTGANVAAALEVARRLGKGSIVVTVAVDTGLKYLMTEPYGEL